MPSRPKVVITQSTLNDTSDLLDLIHLPMIKIEPIAFDTSIFNHHYDWLILTSKNAVDLFMEYYDRVNIDYIASIGKKTSERLEHYGLQVDFEPESYTQEGFIETFDVSRPVKCLYPTSEKARMNLKHYLESKGSVVELIHLYRPVPDEMHIKKMKDIFESISTLTVSSPSAARVLLEHFTVEALNKKQPAAIGRVTASALLKSGVYAEYPEKETLGHMIHLIEERYRGAK